MVLADDQLDALADLIARRLTRTTSTSTSTREDGWLTTAEAAEYLRVSVTTVHRLKARGELPAHQETPNGRLYFRPAELDAWRSR